MGNPVARGHAIGALVIGVMEIVFALIIMICSFVLGAKLNASASVTPYWAGIPYIIPGILGIAVGATKNFCAMVAFMVLNIICFILMGVSAILIVIVVAVYAAAASAACTYNAFTKTCTCYAKGSNRYYHGVSGCSILTSVVALLYAILIFAAFSALAALAGSILACVATCCRGSQPGTVIVQQPVVMQAQQPPAYGHQDYPQKA